MIERVITVIYLFKSVFFHDLAVVIYIRQQLSSRSLRVVELEPYNFLNFVKEFILMFTGVAMVDMVTMVS